MTVIVEYDAGNLMSVKAALERLGEEYVLSSDPELIRTAPKVILPGVGNCATAMQSLRAKGLDEAIRRRRKPLLGICVGMQLMCTHSEEGDVDCLDIFDCKVTKFTASPDCKVPHMGWDSIHNCSSSLLKAVAGGSSVYFVHSYFPGLCTDTIATCRYAGVNFSAALKYENFYGTQFHPEKSGEVGERILKNFLAL